MPPLPDPYLHNLIQQGEHQQLDFKFAVNDARKIARTLGAFSNTDGGTLLIGVKDNGAIAGVRSEEEVYMLESAARLYCRPVVRFEVRKWDLDKKSVLEVIVPKGSKRPYSVKDDLDNWLIYIRVKDQNLLAPRILLKLWEEEDSQEPPVLHYSDKEEILLRFLDEHAQISLPLFCQIAEIPRHLADHIIINMVRMNILSMNIEEKGISFRLKS